MEALAGLLAKPCNGVTGIMLRIAPQEGRVDVDAARSICLALRKDHKWTQGQLAIRLGVHRKAVERIEQRATLTAPRELFDALVKLRDATPAVTPKRKVGR